MSEENASFFINYFVLFCFFLFSFIISFLSLQAVIIGFGITSKHSLVCVCVCVLGVHVVCVFACACPSQNGRPQTCFNCCFFWKVTRSIEMIKLINRSPEKMWFFFVFLLHFAIFFEKVFLFLPKCLSLLRWTDRLLPALPPIPSPEEVASVSPPAHLEAEQAAAWGPQVTRLPHTMCSFCRRSTSTITHN